jgi:hypothetical protein
MDKSTQNISTSNSKKPLVITNFMHSANFYPMCGMILIMIIVLIILFTGTNLNEESSDISNPSKQTTKIIEYIFITLFLCLIIFIICLVLIPNFKELKDLFINITSVTYVIIYTIFLIILFSIIPTDTLNTYAYFFLGITALIGGYSFYKAFSSNYAKDFNINYERIKSIILLFCWITIIIIYYSTDPGGLINKYFNHTILLTIVISVFILLYLIILISLIPDALSSKSSPESLMTMVSKFGFYGSVLFILFITIVTVIIANYQGGFFTSLNKARSGSIIIVILLISILWGILLTANLFPEMGNNALYVSKLDFFKKSLLWLFGLIIAIMLIVWIVYSTQDLSSKSSMVSFIVNILLVLSIMALIYKIVIVKSPAGNEKKNALLNLIVNTIFYIPCMFSKAVDTVVSMNSDPKEKSFWYMLVLAILLLIIYFVFPLLVTKFMLQGGTVLLNEPVCTSKLTSLGNYTTFNKNKEFDYNYAISCWFFLDAFPPSTSPSFNKYCSLLSYAGKPNVTYNSSINSLRVTIKHPISKDTKTKLMDFTENNERIIYVKNKMLLQKWNNLILNFEGGTLDIFLNGELVKTNIEVVPFYTLDNLTVGEPEGYIGGMCNVTYYNKTLNKGNIYYIYDLLKNKNPPLL